MNERDDRMDKKTMTPVKKRKIHIYVRAVIQLLFFILLPSTFTTAFPGQNIFSLKLDVERVLQ